MVQWGRGSALPTVQPRTPTTLVLFSHLVLLDSWALPPNEMGDKDLNIPAAPMAGNSHHQLSQEAQQVRVAWSHVSVC